MSVQSAMSELIKIKRERDVVKQSLITEAAKLKLLKLLDDRVAAISLELEKLDFPVQVAKPSGGR